MSNKYENSKIYKIVSPSNPDLVYYGSTIQKLSIRMAGHRARLNKCTSSMVLDKGDAIILLVENYSCNSKEELLKKEGEYILNNECVNKNVAGRTSKERYQDINKEQINKHRIEYDIIIKDILTKLGFSSLDKTIKHTKKDFIFMVSDMIKTSILFNEKTTIILNFNRVSKSFNNVSDIKDKYKQIDTTTNLRSIILFLNSLLNKYSLKIVASEAKIKTERIYYYNIEYDQHVLFYS